jgi:predicted molibdopterin-dependent oxidoreductase YjgC
MAGLIEITVDGQRHQVPDGIPLAAVLLRLGVTAFRISVQGEPRAPVCGMGSCFECRVTIGGRPHQRSCLVPCTAGLIVHTRR